jgi:uncharacterized protein
MVSPEIIRGYYPASDPVHGFDHVMRVYHLAVRIAAAEGADLEIVSAAALLHDASQAQHEDLRQGHQHSAAELAAGLLIDAGWSQERIEAVAHCIRSHRFRDQSEEPATLEAQVLFDADKLDAIGAIGVARAIAYAVSNGQPVYQAPSRLFIETGRREPEEAHSAYHEYIFKLINLKDKIYTPAGRSISTERHRFMAAYFEKLAKEAVGEV